MSKGKTSLDPALPARIGPVEFSDLDGMVAIRCRRICTDPPVGRRRVGTGIASLAGGAPSRRTVAQAGHSAGAGVGWIFA